MRRCADCGIKLDEDNIARFLNHRPSLCYECFWVREKENEEG